MAAKETTEKGHILLVDDNISMVDYIRVHLESNGYTVTTAESGQAALVAAEEGVESIDVILLDVHMPGMSGIEACQALRSGAHANTPIVFLTADDTEYSEVAGLEAGGNEYLCKPVSAVALEKRVAALVNNNRRMIKLQEAITGWRHEALTDTLTGAHSRKFADNIMQSDASGLWAVMCDIDHFKLYNDSFGHRAGDACLTAVVTVLMSYGHDVIRMGGEEFLILIKKGNGKDIAEQIRKGVESRVIKPDSDPVTISVGAVFMDSGAELSEAIRHADMLLYQSKNNGRNIVTTGNFSDGMPSIPNDNGRRDFRDPNGDDRRQAPRD